jgi:hypothetical protein
MSSKITRQKMIKASEAAAAAVRAEVLEDASERIIAYISEEADQGYYPRFQPEREHQSCVFFGVFWGLKNAWGSAYPDDVGNVIGEAFDSLAMAGRIWTDHEFLVRLRAEPANG